MQPRRIDRDAAVHGVGMKVWKQHRLATGDATITLERWRQPRREGLDSPGTEGTSRLALLGEPGQVEVVRRHQAPVGKDARAVPREGIGSHLDVGANYLLAPWLEHFRGQDLSFEFHRS